MGAFAQTVTGPVSASDLGRTMLHEHLLCDLRDPTHDDPAGWPITMESRFDIDYFQNRNQANMFLDDDGVALAELRHFAAAGGGTIVDVTTGGLSPQAARLADLSKLSGVRIVMGAGFYVESYLGEAILGASVDELCEIMIDQLTVGVGGTQVRAGLIGEIGCSWPLADVERRMLQAAAGAQRRTGAAITIHPGRHQDAPAEIADVIVAAGGDPSRTVIGHMDRTIFDRERLIQLLVRGFILEWDFFGVETSQYWMAALDLDLPTDYMRLDLIRELIGLGHRQQIAISQDICSRTRLMTYGGHGYGHVLRHIAPMMLRRGWSEADVDQLLVATPARLLAYLTDNRDGTSS
jgi:phosphotriesterase-related protein